LDSRVAPILLVVATISVAGGGLFFVYTNPIGGGDGNTVANVPSCTTYSTNYVIIANSKGYNDSINRGVPHNRWPVLCVHEGDFVVITVKNTDTVEPHGFSVAHYFDGGAAVGPGKTFRITFVANRVGNFSIFCTVPCAVHWGMLSGVLVVSK